MSVPSSKRPEPPIGLEAIQSSLDQLTVEERHCLKQALDRRLPEISDWLDTEYTAYARKEGDPSIHLESLRHALAKMEGSMSELVIAERADRF